MHRETTLRVAGVDHVVRTETSGKIRTVKQLESAHTKAVKAVLLELRTAAAPALRDKARKAGEEWRVALAARWERGTFPSHGTYDVATMRKPFPKTSTAPVPEYLVETAPGEYATAEAALDMGVKERVDEVVPGLAVARYGKGWVLQHLPSVSEERPNVHLGPVFKTRSRAREVALTELSRFDFTRSQEEIVADVETAAHVQVVKWREFIAASKKNAWAADRLRQVQAQVDSFAVGSAAA